MQTSERGAALIRSFERLRTVAYLDTIADPPVWTCGYGETGPDIGEHTVWSPVVAEARFQKALRLREAQLAPLLNVDVTQAQWDALMSIGYNAGWLGPKGLGASTLMRMLNTRDFLGAAREFTRWAHAGGKLVDGLVARRTRELLIFAGVDTNY